MFDHIGFSVKDMAASRAFYAAALAPLGIELVADYGSDVGFGRGGRAQFWLASSDKPRGAAHIAFAAKTRGEVHAFYDAALAAGGRDTGPPGLRPVYDPHYYGAFVIDLNGHNIEAVCRSPEA
jgi:catechol 2,3-dioxygenase-like lactoylglutathione lyase family enzyme